MADRSDGKKDRVFLDALRHPTNAVGTLRISDDPAGGMLLSQHRAPAHEFLCGPTSDLVVVAQQNIASSSVLFDLGWGWREHFCSAPNPVYVIPPHADVRWCLNDESQCVYLAIPYADVVPLLEELGVAKPADCVWGLASRGFSESLVHEMVLRLWQEEVSPSRCNPLLASTYRIAIIHALARKWSTLRQPAGKAKAKLAPVQFRKVIAYVNENIGLPLSVETLSRVAGVSPFHFIRLFKNTTGQSPYQYVQTVRTERAKHLLATTSQDAASIGAALGFSSQSAFSRAFKTRTGCSPEQYRRSLLT